MRETKYEFAGEEPIGEGGTAVVFEVQDTQLDVKRALKVLLIDLEQHPEAAKSWRRERDNLLTLEKIDAACVPTIYDIGTLDGLPVIVMQHVEGVTLAQWLANRCTMGGSPLSLNEAIALIQACAVPLARSLADIEQRLEHSELALLCHGDIKPGNIVISTDAKGDIGSSSQVWLLDFGEATLLDSADPTGLTPAYASPEQIRGAAVRGAGPDRRRSDQYQLGAVITEIADQTDTSRRPVRERIRAWGQRLRFKRYCKTSQKMSSRRPADRFASMRGAATALERVRQLPQRVTAMVAAIALLGSASAAAALLLPDRGAGTGNTGLMSYRTEVLDTLIDDEWRRWQTKALAASTSPELLQRLHSQRIVWATTHGSDYAEKAVSELTRRLDLLSGGEFVLTINGATLTDTELDSRVRYPDTSDFDAITLNVWIDGRVVGSCFGRVAPSGLITLDDTELLFRWTPGEKLSFDVVFDSPRLREEVETRERRHAEFEQQLADYNARREAGLSATRPYEPVFMPLMNKTMSAPIRVAATNGNALEIPAAFHCWEVERNGFRGGWDNFHFIRWDFSVRPAN